MDKQERLYRVKKAINHLHGYTTLNKEENIERVVEEILKILEDMIEEDEK